jgi:hypothetical protein
MPVVAVEPWAAPIGAPSSHFLLIGLQASHGSGVISTRRVTVPRAKLNAFFSAIQLCVSHRDRHADPLRLQFVPRPLRFFARLARKPTWLELSTDVCGACGAFGQRLTYWDMDIGPRQRDVRFMGV